MSSGRIEPRTIVRKGAIIEATTPGQCMNLGPRERAEFTIEAQTVKGHTLRLVAPNGVKVDLRILGSSVRLAEDLEGLVVAVNLEDGRVQYHVSWIHNGTRHLAWFSGLELDRLTRDGTSDDPASRPEPPPTWRCATAARTQFLRGANEPGEVGN